MSARGTIVGLALLGALLLGARADAGDLVGIEGCIVDDEGNPVPEYTIWATPPMGFPREFRHRQHGAVTDAEGRFLIEDLLPGEYTLVPGDCDTHARFAAQKAEAGATGVQIEAVRFRTIRGVLRDPAGAPLAGCDVWVRAAPPEGAQEGPRETKARVPLYSRAITNEDGQFLIERYPAKEAVVVTALPPEARQYELLQAVLEHVVPEGPPAQLVAPEALVVAGRVVDEEGHAVAGVSVKASGVVQYMRDGQQDPVYRAAVTDAEGRFELRPFTPWEKVSLTLKAPQDADPKWFDQSVNDVTSGRRDLDITLQRGQVVSGEVVGVPPAELRGLRIHASADRKGVGAWRFDGTTNRFRIQPLPRKTVSLSFDLQRRGRLVLPEPQEVDAPAEGRRFEVARSAVLRGRVESRVEPHRIELTFHDAWKRVHRDLRVRDDGTFEIPGVAPGPGVLVLTACARGRFLVVEGADPTGEPLDLQLVSARTITGRILDLPDKLRGGRVMARRGPLSFEAPIAEDGWFETVPLAPGPWTLAFEIERPRGVIAPVQGVEAGSRDILVEWGRP